VARLLALLMLLLPLLSAGCGGLPSNAVVLVADEDGHTGRALVHNSAGSVDLDHPLAATGTAAGRPPEQPFTAKQSDIDRTFGTALAAAPRKPQIYTLYFGSDSTELAAASQSTLEQAIATARVTPNVDISVVGHSDATGSAEHNMDLSMRRAAAIRDALTKGGVAPGVIAVDYHAANNPAVPSPPGVGEPKNRRVEVTIR
jgi:outer membrane protein OmpA-like peptidoglycan-associated protein